jgi:hypothetical protein
MNTFAKSWRAMTMEYKVLRDVRWLGVHFRFQAHEKQTGELNEIQSSVSPQRTSGNETDEAFADFKFPGKSQARSFEQPRHHDEYQHFSDGENVILKEKTELEMNTRSFRLLVIPG